jgi:hypothetical protein
MNTSDDRRTQRREAIRQLLKGQDRTITSVEFVTDPIGNTNGRYWCDVRLYRDGSDQMPERIEVLIDLEAKRVLRLNASR